MKTVRISAALVAIAALASAPAFAAGSNGKGAAQRPATTHGSPHTTTSPKSSPAAAAPKTHGNPHTTTAPKSSPAAATPKTHGNPHATTTAPASAPTAPTASTAPTTTQTVNPIAEKLQNKPLGARIEKMLPAGMTLDTASAGFRNQGQFIAAVHVSQNLGIPFADLKATMLGTPVAGSTTDTASPMSLGQAIQRLKPFANATTETTRAETQAAEDLRTTTTQTTTSSPTSSSTPTTGTTTTGTTKKPSRRGK